MAEYIEREAVLKRLELVDMDKSTGFRAGVQFGVEHAIDVVKEAPAADVAPVVHGEWVEREGFNFDVYYDCSACGESFCFIEGVPEENFYSYCPNCGAKMDGDGNG